MKKLWLFCLLIASLTQAQNNPVKTQEIAVNELLNGTLYLPTAGTPKSLVILIAGSGPTDRDGNQTGMDNNSLKFLAEQLAEKGIAVFSYDKRFFAMALKGPIDESKLSFDDFIHDAETVVTYFNNQKHYRNIIIAGHSEGSLVGMVAAAHSTTAGFISLAGAGQPIDAVLADQIAERAPMLLPETKSILAQLKKGETVANFSPALNSLFRLSVQPYMISWIKYDPQSEIKKLKIPVLLINGTKDIQVSVSEAELLHKAKPDSQLKIITNMNHIFKDIKGDSTENQSSYSNPNLPVMPELIETITVFVNKI